MEDKNNSFMDSKTILAVVLIGVVWIGWQKYIEQKYPQPETPATNNQAVGPSTAAEVATSTTTGLEKSQTVSAPADGKPEALIKIENTSALLDLSSKGMSFKGITLKSYFDRQNNNVVLNQEGVFGVEVGGAPVDFQIERINEKTFVGRAQVGNYKLTRKVEFLETGFGATSELEIEGVDDLFPGATVGVSDRIHKTESSFLLPSYDNQEVVVGHGEDKVERIIASSLDELKQNSYAATTFTAIGSHYFALGIVDLSQVIPNATFVASPSEGRIRVLNEYKKAAGLNTISIKNKMFFGPKDVNVLKSVDEKLVTVVNFGYFASIARILHSTLKWFYSMVGNWGMAIIFLTLLVRLVVLPFHIMSFKSMKAMQEVQPMIQSLRERYKDDAAALNREMMDLFKRKKVNPLGGCLPMLLQIPVFFALYQVFGQSIDLYRAPFAFWISDLSIKDPFYVLPVLMGIVMFIQQKITPTTMDATQAKIMLAMPVVFSLMMVNLPSALTLYLFVSTFFGIVQQYFVLRQKNKSNA